MNVMLVVAEDRAICESLRAALPETDLVLFEPSTEKALRRLISIKVDVMVVDDSPNLGHQALVRLRETAPDVPVLILSSRSDAETLAGWTLAGARACVIKPFSCETLRSAMETAARRRDLAVVEEHLPARHTASCMTDAPKMSCIGQHQMALRWVSRTSMNIEDPRRLSQSLVDSALDIFDAVRSAVLLETNGCVRVVASHGIPRNVTESLRLTFSSGIMRWFEENTCLFDRSLNRDALGAVKEMQVIGGRLAVPLLIGGRICGGFIIGEKASGLDYSMEERELLSVVGRCASNALEKAQAYRDTSVQHNRLDTILANITAGVVTVLPNRTIGMMNQQAERILQLRAVDVLGCSVQKLGSGFADIVLRTLTDGRPRLRQEIRDPAINANLGMSVTPMGAEGVVVVFSKLPEAAVAREEAAYSPFWEYLSARVAQEIKNPMVAINTFAQLLPKKYDSEDFRDAFFRVVQKEVSRINAVVETLFAFARTPDIVLRRTNLNDTVRSVLNTFEEELEARSIHVETHFDDNGFDTDMDPDHVALAVQNVVQNSIEAMDAGGKLRVTTARENGSLEVRISDTGSGVPPEDAPHIFKPFYSTKERGMGLGLPLAVRILQQHEGDLKLADSGPEGSTFSLTIPAAKVQA